MVWLCYIHFSSALPCSQNNLGIWRDDRTHARWSSRRWLRSFDYFNPLDSGCRSVTVTGFKRSQAATPAVISCRLVCYNNSRHDWTGSILDDHHQLSARRSIWPQRNGLLGPLSLLHQLVSLCNSNWCCNPFLSAAYCWARLSPPCCVSYRIKHQKGYKLQMPPQKHN